MSETFKVGDVVKLVPFKEAWSKMPNCERDSHSAHGIEEDTFKKLKGARLVVRQVLYGGKYYHISDDGFEFFWPSAFLRKAGK